MSVVPLDAAAGGVGLAIAGIAALFNCDCVKPAPPEPPPEDSAVKDAALNTALSEAEKHAKETADEVMANADAVNQSVLGALNSQQGQLAAQADKIKSDIEAINKQWQEAQQGVDSKDPGYGAFKQQYDDYRDYLKSQLDGVNSQMSEIEAANLQAQAALDSKNEWIKQQQQSLIQTKEQKSFLEAVAKGYGGHQGYDINEVNKQLSDLTRREQELNGVLDANNASINYTAQQRDPIGPDPEVEKLNKELQAKKKALDDQIASDKAKRDAQYRKELEEEQKWLQKDMTNKASQAAIWNFLAKGAEVTQVVADTGVDILSNLTGPVGKSIKLGYSGLKGLGSGVGNALSKIDKDSLKDPYTLGEDMSKEILKGSVSGVSDMAKDMIGDKFGNAAKNIYTVGSEAAKGGLEAGLDGKSIVDGTISGGIKGTLDVGTGAVLDHMLPPGEMPKGLDWSDINAKNALNSLKGKSPLTVRSLGKEAIGEGVTNLGKDQIKNIVKGDEVPVIGWKQDFTGDAIEKVYTPAVKAAGKMAYSGAKSLGQTLQNAGI